MSESQKEKPQSFSGYISLIKKIEEIINQVPEKEMLEKEEDSLQRTQAETVVEEITTLKDVDDVEKHTLQLEENISKVG